MNLQCHRRYRRGSSVLEAAAIFTTFFALLIGIIDVGQVLFLHQTLSERARAAARWGVGRPLDAATRTSMQNIVLYNSPVGQREGSTMTPIFGLTRDNVVVDQVPGVGGAPARLTVNVQRYGFQFLAPYLAGRGTGRRISVSTPSELPN